MRLGPSAAACGVPGIRNSWRCTGPAPPLWSLLFVVVAGGGRLPAHLGHPGRRPSRSSAWSPTSSLPARPPARGCRRLLSRRLRQRPSRSRSWPCLRRPGGAARRCSRPPQPAPERPPPEYRGRDRGRGPAAARHRRSLGLADAESRAGRSALGEQARRPTSPRCSARLPARIDDPTLAGLQRALLAAPGPLSGAGDDALFLLGSTACSRWARPRPRSSFSAPVPRHEGSGVGLRRLQARFWPPARSNRPAPPAKARAADARWPEARIVCAALAGDMAAVELGLDLAGRAATRSRPAPGGPRAGARWQAARFPLQAPRARRPAAAAAAAGRPARTSTRRLLAQPCRCRPSAPSPRIRALPPASRAAVSSRARGPIRAPELNGTAPADWTAAAGRRARAQRPAVGSPLPTGSASTCRSPSGGEFAQAARARQRPGPDLLLWRGFRACPPAGPARRDAALLRCSCSTAGPRRAAPVTLRRGARRAPGPRARARRPRAGGRDRRRAGAVSVDARRLPGDDGGRAGRRAPYARRLPARPRRLRGFLGRRGLALVTADADDIRAYLAGLADAGLRPATTARRLAAIRQFYRFLFLEGRRQDDPTAQIDRAQAGAPPAEAAGGGGDRGADRGRPRQTTAPRACGSWPCWSCSTPPGCGSPSWPGCRSRRWRRTAARILIVRGKGGKERMVPIGGAARAGAGRLARGADHFVTDPSRQRWLFPSRGPQRPPDPPARRPAAQGAGARGRHRRTPVCRRTCCATPSPATWSPRRRPARGTGDAWSRRHRHDADLYPCPGRAAGSRGARSTIRWPAAETASPSHDKGDPA